MAETSDVVASNGHIEIDSYTVTYGHTAVTISRRGTMWWVGDRNGEGLGAQFPEGDHEAMMKAAVEYAQRLDEARRAVDKARDQERAAHRWIEDQTYREVAEV